MSHQKLSKSILSHNMNNFKEDDQLLHVRIEHTVLCKCGHSVVLYDYVPKRYCDWCGRTVYNRNEKGQKEKFKDVLRSTMYKQKRKEIDKERESKGTWK